MEAPGTHSQAAATVGSMEPDWSLLSLALGGSGVSDVGKLRLGPVCCLSENNLESAGPSSPCVRMFTRKHFDSHCWYIPPLSLSP